MHTLSFLIFNACSKFLNQHYVTDISSGVLCYVTSFMLTYSNCMPDRNYLQANKTAMGTMMVPCLASIEQTFVDNSSLTPLFSL